MSTKSPQTQEKRLASANTARLVAGAAVLSIGLLVLIGWHTNNEALIEFFPSFSVMQYNTALGLLLCGGGLFLTFRNRALIVVCGMLLILLGSVTLAQYLFGTSFGIDELFMSAYDNARSAAPGRMSQNAALCFFLSGAALLIRRKGKTGYPLLLLKALIGAVIAALAAVSLTGHFFGIQSGYGWESITAMAPHTSAGFILVGIGLIAGVWSEAKREGVDAPHWLPTLVTMAALTATLSLWQVLSAQEFMYIEQTVRAEGSKLKTQIEADLETRVVSLEQMANRWSQHKNGTPRPEWDADARHYIKDFDSFQAIEWADPDFIIRWVEPLPGNEAALDRDLSTISGTREVLENSRNSRVSVLTRDFPLEKNSGIVVYVPIYQAEDFSGFIIGDFRAEDLFNNILPREFAADYSLSLSDGGEPLFAHGETPSEGQMLWAQVVSIESHGAHWNAVVFPNHTTIARLQSPVDETVLIGGLLMCILLVIAVHLAQSSRRRALESAAANRLLKNEIAERERASEELQASETHNRDIIEKSLGFICTHTLGGKWLSVNPAAAGSLGYEPSEMIGRNITEFIAPEDIPPFEKYLAKIRLKRESSGFFNINTRDGMPRTWSFNNVLHDKPGEDAYILGHAIDATERNRVEEELKKARNAALESARIKSEFLANMSHEIRTPMNGVLGMTELLAETPLTDLQSEYVTTIRKSGDSLLAIINDILDFSKIEAGKLRFEEIDFDLRSTVENTVDLFTEQAAGKDIELASLVYSDVEVALRGDPGRLRQILTNLIGNAVKFTESGEITVRVMSEKETAKSITLRFSVHDTGIGIDAEGQKNLFQAFTQADGSMTRKFGGTGLGLTISKQLVEMMEGRIHLDSKVGKGSVFSFTAKFAKQTSRKKRLILRKDLTDLRTLIVDDNETNRNILRHQIESWGLIPSEAPNGPAAIELLREAAAKGRPFNLVILDLAMPGMDGFELARLIKADPQMSSARLILMPSFGKRGHGMLARQISIEGYLIKPVKQDDLFDCIAAVTARPAADSGATGSSAKPLITQHTINEHRGHDLEPILIVEDNIVNQRLIKLQVEKTGYRAEVVPNGREALIALEKKKFTLVLMDCQMPEMDGFAATREIRKNEKAGSDHIPIIAITANVMSGESAKCFEAGMDDFLAKPFKQTELAAMIRKWLKSDRESSVAGLEPVTGTASSAKEFQNEMTAGIQTRLKSLTADVGADVVYDVVGLFIEDSARRLTNLKSAIDQRNFRATKDEAHGLKGSCGNIGASQLAGLCFQLERDATAEDLKGLRATLEKIETAFPLLLDSLGNWETVPAESEVPLSLKNPQTERDHKPTVSS